MVRFCDLSAYWTSSNDLGVADYALVTNFFFPDQTMVTTSKDQRYDGGQYNHLFSVYLEAGFPYYLGVDSDTGGNVIADGVRFAPPAAASPDTRNRLVEQTRAELDEIARARKTPDQVSPPE